MEQHDSESVKEKGEEEPGSVLEDEQTVSVTQQSEGKDETKEAPAETGWMVLLNSVISEITHILEGNAQQDVQENESVETITDQPVRDVQHIFEDDKHLQEDLERLRVCLHCQ